MVGRRFTITDKGRRFLMRGLTSEEVERISNRVSLQKMLVMAVEEEEYVVAARIRDRLKFLAAGPPFTAEVL